MNRRAFLVMIPASLGMFTADLSRSASAGIVDRNLATKIVAGVEIYDEDVLRALEATTHLSQTCRYQVLSTAATLAKYEAFGLRLKFVEVNGIPIEELPCRR